MSAVMNYKDYTGSIEFSEQDRLFYGKVLGVQALISYEGHTGDELVKDFHDAVDSYLSLCEEKGVRPEKAYKGTFNVRMEPELHRRAAAYALSHDMSLNSFVEESVRNELARRCAKAGS
ncbi:MAG: type II toxin-antitoxin system HicB family antitoxin [Clostridia bacterium]|nr:type II toxin-antitoxin system HicB family antitoxin [Clostridia bacterium]